MNPQVAVIRFRYHKDGNVARWRSCALKTIPAACQPGDIWKEEQAAYLCVCVAVDVSSDGAEEDLAKLRARAENWLREQCPDLSIGG